MSPKIKVELNDTQAFILTMVLNEAMPSAGDYRKAVIEEILTAIDNAEDVLIAEGTKNWQPEE